MLALAVCLIANRASANAMLGEMGDPIAEPLGGNPKLEIVREVLVMDWRSLANAEQDDRQGQISALYTIQNPGAPTPLPLLFVSPDIAKGQVTLNGSPIPARSVKQPPLPAQWNDPIVLPALKPERGGSEEVTGNGDRQVNLLGGARSVDEKALRFDVALPKGTHQLRVNYAAKPTILYLGNLHQEYQLGYLLAPAKTWATVGQLEVEVRLPPSWEYSTSLPLQGRQGVLTGRFQGLPADGLAIVTRAPLPPQGAVADRTLRWGSWILGIGLLIALGRSLGKRLPPRQSTPLTGATRTRLVGGILGLMVLGGVGLAIVVVIGQEAGFWAGINPQQVSATYRYGQNIVSFLLALLGIGVGAIVLPVTALVSRPKHTAPAHTVEG